MTLLSYPEFVEGQTLTREELNDLRDHLIGRDRTLGRTVGFGIAGGLIGRLQGGTLHIVPGLAIDQTGEALLLPTEQQIPVPPGRDADTFDFVTGTDGFTVVLVHTDVPGQRTPCTETGCQGHALPHTTGADLRIVRGRLTSAKPDFENEELLTGTPPNTPPATPLTLTPNGAVVGDFAMLRNRITGRIGTRLRPALLAKLSAMTLATTDLPAVQAYKAGFLNQVLFAALDLLRFEALVSEDVLRDTHTPGVALGWLHQTGGTWVWDCGYRHQWEPPIGLTQALFGGSCADPGLPWLQRLESLIDTFTLPPMPKPDDDPVKLEKKDLFICKYWNKRGHADCNVIPYPRESLRPDWKRTWTDRTVGTVPPVYYLATLDYELYDVFPPDSVDVGVIDVGCTFGRKATEVQAALVELVADAGLTPSVDLVTLDKLNTVPGFAHSGVLGAADKMVLIQDGKGKVVGTGRVAIGESQRQLGTALPLATQQAAAALQATSDVRGQVDAHDKTIATQHKTLEDLQAFQTNATEWQTGVNLQLSGVPTQIETHTVRQIANFQQEFSGQLGEFVAQTVRTLTDKVSVTAEQVQNVAGRVDVLIGTRAKVADREVAVNAGLLEVLRTVRAAVEEVTPDDRRDAVRTTLAAADDGLTRMAAAGEAGGSVLADSPQTLAAVVDSLVAALRAAGVRGTALRTLNTRNRALRRALEQ
jgi:hypothetical protein